MENFKNFYGKYHVYLSRSHLEILAAVTIVFCAVLVFFLNIPGKGVLKLDNGNIVYDGSLVRGKMNGQGTITFQNGDQYTGGFNNGAFNGKGTFQSKEGWTYEGDFEETYRRVQEGCQAWLERLEKESKDGKS